MQSSQSRKKFVYHSTKRIVVRLVVRIVGEKCQPDFPDLAFGLGAQVAYKVQNGQVVESIEMEKILRIHDGKTFMIDQSVRS